MNRFSVRWLAVVVVGVFSIVVYSALLLKISPATVEQRAADSRAEVMLAQGGSTIFLPSSVANGVWNAAPGTYGVKFRTNGPGTITAVRFYRVPGDTSTSNTVGLFAANGALLAQGAGGVGGTGWQQITIPPVSVVAGTTYVATYFSGSGYFGYNHDFFTAAYSTNANLYALGNGTDGPNGVYAQSGALAFPTGSQSATNYWVDVVFSPGAAPTATPTTVAPTATPTRTPTPAATSTTMPTPTMIPTSVPTSGQECPAWYHAQITTQGPDGEFYPTWHPEVDAATGCWFGHSHGMNTALSQANSTPPAFGYAGKVAARAGLGAGFASEPHVGFKCLYANRGDIVARGEFQPGPARDDGRVCFHQGTAGVGGFTTQLHSVIYDWVGGGPIDGQPQDRSGQYVHYQGLADTHPNYQIGSTCGKPIAGGGFDGARGGGRDFSMVGCPDPYEIWPYDIVVWDPLTEYYGPGQSMFFANPAFAVADPILTADPANLSAVIYTQQYRAAQYNLDPSLYLSGSAFFRGCRIEEYIGPNYFKNYTGRAVQWTSPQGVIDVPASVADQGNPFTQIRQLVSPAFWSGTDAMQHASDCTSGFTHAPN